MSTGAPRPRTGARGIDDGYEDAAGRWQPTAEPTRRAILAAMARDHDAIAPSARHDVRVLREGESLRVGPAEVALEDGTSLRVADALPPHLPKGYHELREPDGNVSRLIVAPRRCPLPPRRAWGWTVQLYAARSAASWGIGDFADLRRLAEWSASLGAGFLLVNPLTAPAPVVPQEPSPYFPSSRRFRNPLHLRVEEVPGAEALPDLDDLAAQGRALNAERRIDRDAVLRLKLDALGRLWARWRGCPRFDAFRAEHGRALESFAVFCVLAERPNVPNAPTDWPNWSMALPRPIDSLHDNRLARAIAAALAAGRKPR